MGLTVVRAAGSPTNSSLPILVIQTGQQPVMDRTRVLAHLIVFPERVAPNTSERIAEWTGRAELSVRGHSSYFYAKKSYRLELQDENGTDLKRELLGMSPESDWVLVASVPDRSFVRNVLASELWRATGRCAVRWRFVELFVMTNAALPALKPDGAISATDSRLGEVLPLALARYSETNGNRPDPSMEPGMTAAVESLAVSYMGLYVLMEKIKRGADRVNIARLRPRDEAEPEITGGYIIKKDDKGRGERGLMTGQEFRLRFEAPKERELTLAQRRWMTGHLDRLEAALFGRRFRDPLNGYAAYLDVDSFVDFHWLVEVARNADGYWVSQYMSKDRGGKLAMGPLWDWDRTFGNLYFDRVRTNGWRFERARDPDYTWYRRLFEDPDFLQRYVDRWAELRAGILATSNALALVDRIVGPPEVLGAAHGRDYRRWAPALSPEQRAHAARPHAVEVAEVKRWITDRLLWIDGEEYPRPVVQLTAMDKERRSRLTMTNMTGRIYYTTDGSDPRARGGAPASQAIAYQGPVEISATDTITARVRSEFGLWSAPVVTAGR